MAGEFSDRDTSQPKHAVVAPQANTLVNGIGPTGHPFLYIEDEEVKTPTQNPIDV